MGIHTDYLGHVLIRPELSPAETAYLTAFNQSRRWDRPGGPYEVPANPGAEERPARADQDAYNRPPPGQPQLWCPWVPCLEGHCLGWDRAEKPYAGTDWLRYLIDTFLRPGAAARTDRSGRFDGFTFDHHLDGALVGSVSESGALFLLRIDDGDVSEVGLLAPDPTDLCDPRTHARRARSDAARSARWERWVAAVAADEA